MTRRPWLKSEEAVLRARFPHESTIVIAAALRRTVPALYQRAYALGIHKTAEYLSTEVAGRLRRADTRGSSSRFVKGHVPANKGLRRPGWGPGRMREHQFKPGCRMGLAATNWRPVGTIACDAEGYHRIKVREAVRGEAYGFGNVRVWPLLNRYVWAQAHGPIPAGHSIAFKDGNKGNCALDNLECVSRAEMMKRNTVHNLPKPVARAVQLIGVLNRQIRKREQHGQEQNHRPS